MAQEILDIITKNLTNERLDSIIQQDVEYRDVLNRVNKSFKELIEIEPDNKNIQKIIDNYDSTIHEELALIIKLAYQQGMKDIVQLLLSLL